MPATDFLPRRLYNAFSKAGFLSEPLKGLLALQNNPEYVSFFDDFVGTRTGSWPAGTPYASTIGTNTEVIGITQAVGGTMTVTTGSAGSDSAGQALGLNWSADRGFYFIARMKIVTRITNMKFEIGVTDSVSDDGAVLAKGAETYTATDCAVVVLDTGDDDKLTFRSNGGTADANSDWSGTLINGTYFLVEIVGSGPTDTTGDFVACYINGQLVGSGGIGGSAPLTPWVYIEDLAQSSATTLAVDYWGIVGPRVAQWGVST